MGDYNIITTFQPNRFRKSHFLFNQWLLTLEKRLCGEKESMHLAIKAYIFLIKI